MLIRYGLTCVFVVMSSAIISSTWRKRGERAAAPSVSSSVFEMFSETLLELMLCGGSVLPPCTILKGSQSRWSVN
jgi:hypothetical protein